MATIRDVAIEARVSIATVSHVVNKTRPVAVHTAERVVAAMDRLRYRPEPAARRLRMGAPPSFGLLAPPDDDPMIHQLIRDLEMKGRQQGVELKVAYDLHTKDPATSATNQLLDARTQAVAILPGVNTSDVQRVLTRHSVPTLLVDNHADAPSPHIQIDHKRGMERAVEHLLRLGHRNFAFVSGSPQLESTRLSLEAYEQVMQFKPTLQSRTHHAEPGIEGSRQMAREVLLSQPRPTAAICAKDLSALALISAATMEGLRIPDDISVLGCEGIQIGRIAAPPLTTTSVPPDKLSDFVWRALNVMADSPEKGEHLVLVPELHILASTGPAPSSAPVRNTAMRAEG